MYFLLMQALLLSFHLFVRHFLSPGESMVPTPQEEAPIDVSVLCGSFFVVDCEIEKLLKREERRYKAGHFFAAGRDSSE